MRQLPCNIVIQSPLNDHYVDIAKLHAEGIKTGFLSTLGVRVLKEIYKGIEESKYGGIQVAICEGEVVGYVSYTTSIAKLYREVLLKKGLILSVLLMPCILRYDVVKKILETIVYPFKKSPQKSIDTQHSKDRPELLSIAVHDSWRGFGIGKKLIATLEDILSNEYMIQEYHVVTLFNNKNSNEFYKSCGYEQNMLFFHHENQMVEYIKRIEKE